jgi:hypothetical protein
MELLRQQFFENLNCIGFQHLAAKCRTAGEKSRFGFEVSDIYYDEADSRPNVQSLSVLRDEFEDLRRWTIGVRWA